MASGLALTAPWNRPRGQVRDRCGPCYRRQNNDSLRGHPLHKFLRPLVAMGALILAGAVPQFPFVQLVGIATLWAAAILTLVTGWDYLRVGIKHMD